MIDKNNFWFLVFNVLMIFSFGFIMGVEFGERCITSKDTVQRVETVGEKFQTPIPCQTPTHSPVPLPTTSNSLLW